MFLLHSAEFTNAGYLVANPFLGTSGHLGGMDILGYDYTGNRLAKVSDTGSEIYGFRDGTNTNDDFGYDANGNVIGDENMGDSCPASQNLEASLPVSGTVEDLREATQSITVTNATLLPGAHLRISNGSEEELIVYNGYDSLGQLVHKKVGGAPGADYQTTTGLQTVDYIYNVRGWLTGINDVTVADPDKLFNFKINYNTQNHGAAPLFNGNISETEWRTDNTDSSLKWYRYGFDALNRLTGAVDNSADQRYSLTNVAYDKNGNVLGLTRKGHLDSGGTSFGNMDVLGYVYDSGNKVLRINDSGNDGQGFRDGTNTNDDFEYDGNGNLVLDRNKGITSIAYNHLNMPTLVDLGVTGDIEMVYAADGTKLKKTASDGTVTEYANGYVYENNTLQFCDHPEGYVMPDGVGWRYVYQYKDQVGNIRLSYTDNNGTLEIVEENNYYPFGGKMRGYNSNVSPLGNSTAQRWKFGGKELDESLNRAMGTYDFGARIYDPWGVRWWNIDPLAEKSFEHSPYVYANNNPIFFVDPDGNEPIPGPFTGRVIKDKYGKLTAWRITSNQRYALGVQSAIASSANIVGTIVGLKDAFSQKEPDWVRDLNKKTLALSEASVEGFGEFLKANKAFVGPNVIPNMSKVGKGLNAVGIGLAALDYEATAQEKLESYTFQFAEGLMDFSGISGANPGLLVVTPEAGRTVEGLENSLNTIYLGISLLTQDFDLSTDEGTTGATKYLQENQKIVVQFIKFLQQQNRKLEEQEQNETQ